MLVLTKLKQKEILVCSTVAHFDNYPISYDLRTMVNNLSYELCYYVNGVN